MPDPEVKWTPKALDATVRGRAISATVLAVSCVVIGIIIGWATAGIPDRMGLWRSVAIGTRPAKESAPKANQADNIRPSLALKSETEAVVQKTVGAPNPQAAQKPISPPVVLINPGTAGEAVELNTRREVRRSTQERLRGRRELPQTSQQDSEPQATDRAQNYQSLRRYMLGR